MTLEWRALARGETDHETLWASVAAASVVMLALWMAFVEWPPVLCPLQAIAGLPCPTCGATRAVFALVGGRPLEALRLNPLVTAGLLLAVPYVGYAATVAVLGLPRLRVRVRPPEARVARVAFVSVVVATWVFLIVDGR